MSTSRIFYRCRLCLEPQAVEGPSGADLGRPPTCPFCGHDAFEYLGYVKRAKLVQDHELSACDARCTNSTGPNCDCKCGCANHGTQRTRWVVREVGGVPQLRQPDEAAVKKVKARMAAFADALAGAQARYAARFGTSPSTDGASYKWQFRLRKAMKMKSHAARIKALNEVLPATPPAVSP